MAEPQRVAQLRAGTSQDEGGPTHALHRRLEGDAPGQPFRAPPGGERPRILATGQGLQSLAADAELRATRAEAR